MLLAAKNRNGSEEVGNMAVMKIMTILKCMKLLKFCRVYVMYNFNI